MKKHLIKPYGDTLNDGMVQLSFTLPVENGPKARKAAELYTAKLNFDNISVVHAQKIAEGFTAFVVFASAIPTLDFDKVSVKELRVEPLGFEEINHRLKEGLRRPARVVGATIGSDAHTVGIDAIMNPKGYDQDYGLERYPWIEAHNLGAQVPGEALLAKAMDLKADALLISQTVTKNDGHIRNYQEFMGLVQRKRLRKNFLLIMGGPGITHELAVKLRYDAGFGPGTRPSQVAAFLAQRLVPRPFLPPSGGTV